jgi:polyisoprenoid-binding protein YceI
MTNRRVAVPFASFATALLLSVGGAPYLSAQSVTRYVVAPQENEARYLIREQLARIDFPNDAVGRTSAVTGGITVDEAGRVVAGESRFVIDMRELQSDSDRRDNFVRRNTLQTGAHPHVQFVPTSLDGVSFPLPAAGELQFRMRGDLTVRGVTRPVSWAVTATIVNGALRGEARTQFTFADFDITKPRVASVLSVDDDIRLEYSFFLVPRP